MIYKYYPHFKYFLLNVFGLLYSTENIILAYIVGNLTNMAAKKEFNSIPKFFLEVLVALTIVLLSNLIFNYLKTDAIKQTNIKLRKSVLKGMLTTNQENSSNLGLLTNDFKLLETNRYEAEIQILVNIYTVILALSYSLYLNIWLTFIFLIGSIIPTIVSNLFQNSIKRASTEWVKSNDKYVNQIKYFLAGTELFNLYGEQDNAVNQNIPNIINLENNLAKMNLTKSNTNAYLNIIAIISTFVVPFSIGIILVINNQTTLGALLAIVQLSNSFTNPILQILNERNNLSTTTDIVEKLEKFVNKASQITNTKPIIFKSLNIKNLNLIRHHHTLAKNINFNLYNGQKAVIIGPSGSGKSTFLQFLMYGLYGNSAKLILNNEVAKKGSFQNLFSYASQKPIIFPETLWFNLTLGKDLDIKTVSKICEKLGLADLIKEKGFNYKLGSNADQLSGGQISRIGLARAILEDRPIILLDEINASLDKKTSKLIHEYLIESDLTFIEVNHHYTSAELLDYDFVLDLNKFI